jgi:adenine-specific DNA methylase
VFEDLKEEIFVECDDRNAEVILTLIGMTISRQIQYNNRLAPWYGKKGIGQGIFMNNNFSIKRMFVNNNICAPRSGISKRFNHTIDSYESLCSFLNSSNGKGTVYNEDAANLSQKIGEDDVGVAVVDPPYFDSVMYGELSDLSYVIEKRLFEGIHDNYSSKLSEKVDQAVANPERHDSPEEFYKEKMEDIFSEMKEVLVDDGILTLMFTDREVRAWNIISKAIIESGFTITSTHPIKTEKSDRIGARQTASVNSSILLVARNRKDEQNNSILWEEIEEDIERTARKEAVRLLSIDDIDKIDTSIAAFGPALEQYSEAYPVEDKQGEEIEPRKVLEKARKEVTNVIANDELNTETDSVDGLTRWYILCYTIYGEADIPFDEANQLGIGTDVEITEIKTQTKVWSKSRGDVSLNDHTDRVQDIVKLQDDRADNPSSRKYPVDPTATTFTYAIDAVHAALHVYEREGSQFSRDWLAERGFKNDTIFTTTVKALLEAVPNNTQMHDTLTDLIAGETGDYLDISVSGLNITNNSETQTGLEEF